MKLRVRLPKNPAPLELDLDDDLPVNMLPMFLEELAGIPAFRMKLLAGLPPKAVDMAAPWVPKTPPQASPPPAATGTGTAASPVVVDTSQKAPADNAMPTGEVPLRHYFRDGDMLVVHEGESQVQRGHTDGKYIAPCHEQGRFVRRDVPSDNSCLFHAVYYVCEARNTLPPPHPLRQRIHEAVLTNKSRFTAAVLGQPPEHYAQWIMHDSSWGGAIELTILSFLYQTEIVVCDLSSKRLEHFGETQGYATRTFVCYTGKHYDALGVLAPMQANAEQVQFNVRDPRPLELARRFVNSA